MEKRIAVLAAAAVWMGVFGAAVCGGAPLGPPWAFIGEGQWILDFEYGFEEMDLESRGSTTLTDLELDESECLGTLLHIKGLQSSMLFASAGYGINQSWDVFGRVGIADAKDEITARCAFSQDFENVYGWQPNLSYGGDFGFAWGIGTRGTLGHWGPWRAGFVGQFTWFDPGRDSFSVALDDTDTFSGKIDAQYWQAKFSLAAICQMGNWYFWGGPLAQFVEGDLDMDGSISDAEGAFITTETRTRIRTDSYIGGHAGVLGRLTEQIAVWGEGQVTSDSWLLGLGVAVWPEGLMGGY